MSPSKSSDRHENVARFYEEAANNLDKDNGFFLGGVELNAAEKKMVQSKLRRLTVEHRRNAAQYRADDR